MENIFSSQKTDFLDEINPIFNLTDGNSNALSEDLDTTQNDVEDNVDIKDSPENVEGSDVSSVDESAIDEIAKMTLGFKDEDDEDEETKQESSTERSRGGNANKAIKKLIEKGVLLPFEDDKDISKYTSDDIVELIEANISEIKQQILDKAIEDLLESMPDELKFLNKYYLEGGKDLKNMFQVISKISDIKSLEVGKDDEMIVRLYLKQNNWDDEDIEEEIDALKKADKLTDRAAKYKDKLDAMQEEIVKKAIEEQNNLNKQRTELINKFVNDVKKTLSDGVINDVKINSKQVHELIDGLISPKYESITGKKTNKLGYLLEKYQFIEPNIKLISEVLWLLSNPDEYKNMLIEKGRQKAMEEIRRDLKTESQRNLRNATMYNDKVDDVIQPQKRKLTRPSIFDRNF